MHATVVELQRLLMERQAAGKVLAEVDAFFRWGSGDVQEGERMMARDAAASAELRRTEAALNERVQRLRREQPEVLKTWVDRSLALVDVVEAEVSTSGGWVSSQREEWPRVLDGEVRWVSLRTAPIEDKRVLAWFELGEP